MRSVQRGTPGDVSPSRIALAGDWHGNTPFARKAIRLASELGAEGILHLGDFGIWPGWAGDEFVDRVDEQLADYGMWLQFIDGNHEDHWQLAAMTIRGGVRLVRPNITHLPRGYRWQWHGRTWVALGGAISLDKHLRKPGISWWPEEAVTVGQASRVVLDGPADFMITHDAPSSAKIPGLMDDIWRPDALRAATSHRELLQHIVHNVSPERLWHGHFHVSYTAVIPVATGNCIVRGLGADVDGLAANLAIIDLEDL